MLLAAAVTWRRDRRRVGWLPMLYSVFLIVYLTLLRREPGGVAVLRWELALEPGASAWAGECLNLVLYLPFGWAALGRQKKQAGAAAAGGLLGLALRWPARRRSTLRAGAGRIAMTSSSILPGLQLGALLRCMRMPGHKGKPENRSGKSTAEK